MGQNAGWAAKVEAPGRLKGGTLFRPVNYFFLGAILLILIMYRRDPRMRPALLTLLRDQKAMTFGVIWVIFALAVNFANHGFRDVLNIGIQALFGGFVVATILNWFYRRKQGSSGQ